MPIPEFQDFMLPFLECLADGADHRMKDLVTVVANRLGVTPAERTEMVFKWTTDSCRQSSRMGEDLFEEGWSCLQSASWRNTNHGPRPFRAQREAGPSRQQLSQAIRLVQRI